MTKIETTILGLFFILMLLVFVFTQFTIFVIPPKYAQPGGKTILMFRLSNGKLIDSPSASCHRVDGSLNDLCHRAVVAGVLKKGGILLKLPYFKFLERASLIGREDLAK